VTVTAHHPHHHDHADRITAIINSGPTKTGMGQKSQFGYKHIVADRPED
jgi:hypothetical protein